MSKIASGTRSSKRSKKEKIAEGSEVVSDMSQKRSSADQTDSLKLGNSSSAAVTDGRRRRGKCTVLAKPRVDTSTECQQTDETALRHDGVDSHSIEQTGSAAHVADHTNNVRRKVKGRKTRSTRQSSGIDVENEAVVDDEELPGQQQSQLESVELAVSVVTDVDIVAGRSGEQAGDDEHDVVAVGPAAECLSDRTELLSVPDDDDDDDDDEYTRRSSPASYKSEEDEPRVMVTACHDNNEDSRGNRCVTMMLTLLGHVMVMSKCVSSVTVRSYIIDLIIN